MKPFVAVVVAVFAISFAGAAVDHKHGERIEAVYGLPGAHLERTAYLLGTPNGHYTPWVLQHLDAGKLAQNATRDGHGFRTDEDQPAECRWSDSDYQGSGYDRGHLFPAEDGSYSAAAMRSSFRLTNTCPETPGMNRGTMHAAENAVRKFAEQDGADVWCYTIPVFAPVKGKLTIGTLGPIWIPTHVAKAVLIELPGKRYAMRAWMIPNVDEPPGLADCETTVDAVEAASGLSLFSGLDENLQSQLESSK